MESYKPLALNPNEVFGFTKPIESPVVAPTPNLQPDWRLILVGGILVVVFVWLYQGSQIEEMRRVVFRGRGMEEDI